MVSTKEIAELREKSGAGVMAVKEALTATNGNMEEALVYLRKKGLADVQGRAAKTANEGTIGVYVHAGSKMAVLTEISCETDFVGKSADFQAFAKDVAMHIAATNPKWISRDDVPLEVLKTETDVAMNSIEGKKPLDVVERIVQGKLNRFYKENCLLEQPFVKDSDLTINDLLGELVSKVGEKVVVKRFCRFAVGG